MPVEGIQPGLKPNVDAAGPVEPGVDAAGPLEPGVDAAGPLEPGVDAATNQISWIAFDALE
jgi:hypothetical protein